MICFLQAPLFGERLRFEWLPQTRESAAFLVTDFLKVMQGILYTRR
jgi:hypothetical protein